MIEEILQTGKKYLHRCEAGGWLRQTVNLSGFEDEMRKRGSHAFSLVRRLGS